MVAKKNILIKENNSLNLNLTRKRATPFGVNTAQMGRLYCLASQINVGKKLYSESGCGEEILLLNCNPTEVGCKNWLRLINLFLSTVIFSKRRKISTRFEEKPEHKQPTFLNYFINI